MYVFVLKIDPNGQPVLPVHFWSQNQPIRSILLYQSYNIMVYDNATYCINSATNKLG
jgi:hypothetical protein